MKYALHVARARNLIIYQPKVESPETASLLMECVAETGGCRVSRSVRCARYARESLAGCERRACGAGEAAEPPRAQQMAPLAL